MSNIIIGISSCLLGNKVRYDSSGKRSVFCTDVLNDFVEYKPFCPEVAVGLPIPRPTIRQIRRGDVIHVSQPDGTGDVTEALTEYGQTVGRNISEISGFIFTAKSPSCGMERVKIYHEGGGGSDSSGIGLFTKQIMQLNPLLPCEENGRLNDAVLRENFVLRVFTYKAWQDLIKEGITKGKLIEFHSQRKYLVMSHHYPSYQELGRLLAIDDISLEDMQNEYIKGLMTALKNKANRRSHTNTLTHLQGYFKKHINAEEKAELCEKIADYREGLIPLLVPLTLLEHYNQKYPNEYLQKQVYFNPYPREMKLRYAI